MPICCNDDRAPDGLMLSSPCDDAEHHQSSPSPDNEPSSCSPTATGTTISNEEDESSVQHAAGDEDEQPQAANQNHHDQHEEEPETTTLSDMDKVVRHMEQNNLQYFAKRGGEKEIVSTFIPANGTVFQVVFDIKQDDHMLILYVFLPVKVPSEKRLDVAEYITRANYGIMIGNFEMDFSDGEVRFKGAIDYSEESHLVDGMILTLLGKSVGTMGRYFPGMMRILYGDVRACDAIREIEPSQARGNAVEALAEALVQACTVAADANNGGEGGEEPTVCSSAISDNDVVPIVTGTPSPAE